VRRVRHRPNLASLRRDVKVAGEGQELDAADGRRIQDTIGKRTPVVMWGATSRVVSQMTRGIAAPVACRVMCGIAGRMIRPIAPAVIRLTPDRIPCVTTDEGLRRVTSKTAPRTVYDTTV
jgi:hypothetical protein